MGPPRPAPGLGTREPLTGFVERVTFHSADTGWAVLRVKARGHRDLVTVVGHVAAVSPGEHVQASGRWTTHRDHGPRFAAEFLRAVPPTSLEGIERYLGSGLVKGIGPHFARRLVRAFGDAVFDVVEQAPGRLLEVEGIGRRRAARITSAWAEQKAIREIMSFLQSHGVGTGRTVRIFKTYGADAVALVAEDPYRLARDIRGIGFKTADAIAERLGIPRTAMIRARAGVSYALLRAVDDGHCGLPHDELLGLARELLGIPDAILEEAVALEVRDGRLAVEPVEGGPCVFLRRLRDAEIAIRDRLAALARGSPPWGVVEADGAAARVAADLGFPLAASQRAALATVLSSKVAVVTGGPGVGKTTLLDAVLRVLVAAGARVLLAAPTGRAARRMSEATRLEARTVHRLLEVDPGSGGFRRGRDLPLDCDLLVLDESSMLDVPLAAAVLEALPARAGLLLVGDVDQLPSVGPGRVLADVIASGAVPVVRLTEVFRQAARSRIVVAAHAVNSGRMPDLAPPPPGETSDFYFVPADDAEDALAKVVEVVASRIPRRFGLDPVRDVQVLAPMNRGAIGVRALNAALQAALRPPGDGPAVERFGWTYRAGDKVLQTENDYEKEVFNGDIGFVAAVDPDARQVLLAFDGREVAYDLGELDRVALAYATTVHKSQGSEYPAVVIPVTTAHYPMLKRDLLYTAITRGRRLVVLVGQRRAIGIAVRSATAARRWSRLRELLETA